MASRDISEDAIDYVLVNYHTTLPRRKGGHEYIGEYAGRRLKVVIDDRSRPAFVVTVHWMDG